ncbi:DNA adenine methylase [Salmonella enterica subsp. diarizonae]|uniref:DNA adenine methylase n=1 Tax=Klebsiella/Raoultella group TaxID=2890311 RepID=UPI00107764C5|nr:DNA adenine methylase [Klebsiella pneumoniae]EAB9444577.1 DNA adenine methylase [Salmonella enterica subsp. diarizonae]ECI3359171.1 DNA adenine methylase [Salmonella enterica subsp. diarizonae]WFB71556.1 DNA adenine methylase [Klebsiella pneumoniae]HAT3924368.1 DNA adenine methylase [Citrobacter amalonaticus]
MRNATPLRYPGGKGKLTEFLKDLIKINELEGCTYVEPYAGGAGVALNLLFDGVVSHIVLNDLNPSIYAFWHSVLCENDALCEMIANTQVNMDEWYKQKEIQSNAQEHSLLTLGFSTFYLNRTNRSGIINAGVIGGKEQTGKWKIDARYNKEDLINRIKKIGTLSDAITLYNSDAINLLNETISLLDGKVLVYLDPPYYVKGQGLYQNFYQHDDHVNIGNTVINKLHIPWIVSYDATKEILDIYKNQKKIIYGLSYSAQRKHVGSEVMFFSEKLIIPTTENPSKHKK